jgi:hypothetical protein
VTYVNQLVKQVRGNFNQARFLQAQFEHAIQLVGSVGTCQELNIKSDDTCHSMATTSLTIEMHFSNSNCSAMNFSSFNDSSVDEPRNMFNI